MISREKDIQVYRQKFNTAVEKLTLKIKQDENHRITDLQKICEDIQRNFIELKKVKEVFRRQILINEIISLRNSLV